MSDEGSTAEPGGEGSDLSTAAARFLAAVEFFFGLTLLATR